jgi:DNA repair exonuclease SbcCD ATPase subunit
LSLTWPIRTSTKPPTGSPIKSPTTTPITSSIRSALTLPLPLPLTLPLTLAPLLLALAPTAFAGGETRPWRRRKDAARTAALAARDAASEAFLRLDTAQRDMMLSLETVRAVRGARGTEDALRSFAAVSLRIDEASAAYIGLMDRHPLDAELETNEYEDARRELDDTARKLDAVREELDRFGTSLGPILAQAEHALAQLPPAVDRARRAAAAAAQAVADTERAGLGAATLTTRLTAIRTDLTELDRGPAALGIPGTLEVAARIETAAADLRTEAERLPKQREEVTNRLSSLRTRTQALESRLTTVEPALHRLRTDYTQSCWTDLEQVPAKVRQALGVAHARLEEAGAAAGRGEYTDAASRLATARATLKGADEAMASVHDRLTGLEEVARDPEAELERTRFALRDAQRLALGGRANAEERYARRLDALVYRLEAIAAEPGKHRPDWWRFLSETRAIRAEVAETVQVIREDRAGPGTR